MRNIFFIADTHFFHAKIIQFCKRPYENVQQMNQDLINKWNAKIKSTDKVFMLGDFSLGGRYQTEEIAQQLNGNKTIILGNHDRLTNKAYLDMGFKEVYRYPILWNERYLLSHVPLSTVPEGFYNIHGHFHNNAGSNIVLTPPNYFCTSVEVINYEPICATEILKKKGMAIHNV